MLEVRERVLLAPLTTFGIGGPARYLVDVHSEDECREAIGWAKEKNLPFVFISGGSNLLISDAGIDALVIRLTGDRYELQEGQVDAWTGSNLLGLIRAVGAQGYGGWEKLAGIPGALGGAIRGNAGAFGSEIADFVETVRALNTQTGEMREFSNVECDFSYRNSFFKQHPEWIVVQATLRLITVEPSAQAVAVSETIAERERRHLQDVKAAGSYFMNPTAPAELVTLFESEKQTTSREGRVPAGWLIEKAGLKGASVGGALCSLQHPNYIVNTGTATAEDVRALAQKVKEVVKTQFGIELHEEAAILGL